MRDLLARYVDVSGTVASCMRVYNRAGMGDPNYSQAAALERLREQERRYENALAVVRSDINLVMKDNEARVVLASMRTTQDRLRKNISAEMKRYRVGGAAPAHAQEMGPPGGAAPGLVQQEGPPFAAADASSVFDFVEREASVPSGVSPDPTAAGAEKRPADFERESSAAKKPRAPDAPQPKPPSPPIQPDFGLARLRTLAASDANGAAAFAVPGVAARSAPSPPATKPQ